MSTQQVLIATAIIAALAFNNHKMRTSRLYKDTVWKFLTKTPWAIFQFMVILVVLIHIDMFSSREQWLRITNMMFFIFAATIQSLLKMLQDKKDL